MKSDLPAPLAAPVELGHHPPRVLEIGGVAHWLGSADELVEAELLERRVRRAVRRQVAEGEEGDARRREALLVGRSGARRLARRLIEGAARER